MAKKTRAVLVGCGGISGAWLNTDTVRKQVNIVGFVDLDKKAATQRAKVHGAADAVVGTDMNAVLKATQPDVVFDCTTPNAHHKVATAALRAGCHVLGEKPMADTVTNARKMLAASVKADRVGAVIQNRRFLDGIRALRKFIDTGRIGRVHTIQSNFFIGAHFGGFRDHMKHVLLLDMAIHTFDQARLISQADAQSAYCLEWNPPGSWYDHDASAIVLFEMSDNIKYTYQGSWCSEGCNTSWEGSWHIIGEKGSVTWDGGTNFKAQAVTGKDGFVRKVKDCDVPIRVAKKLVGGHEGVIKDFLLAVKAGATPETAYADNIKSLAMVEAAIQSADLGRKVKVKQ